MEKWMLLLVIFLGLLFLGLVASLILWILYVPQTKESLFRIKDYAVNHQGSTSMDVLVHHVYKTNARYEKMAKRTDVMQVIKTVVESPSFNDLAPWEVLAADIGDQLYNDYDVIGVSVEVIVPANSDVSAATYTKGYANRVLKFDSIEQ